MRAVDDGERLEAKGLTRAGQVIPLHAKERTPGDDLRPATDGYALIEEKEVSVVYVRSFQKTMFKDSRKLCVLWQVVAPEEEELNGTVVWSFYRLRNAGKVAVSSRYYRDWTLATGRKPSRRDRMSPQVFSKKLFRARLKQVDKDSRQRKIPRAAQYSVLDYLIEVVAG